MTVVYPRLPTSHAIGLLQERSGLGIDELRSRSDNQHPQSEWYATAIQRVSREQLSEFQTKVRDVAGQFGYPDLPTRRSTKYIGFDGL